MKSKTVIPYFHRSSRLLLVIATLLVGTLMVDTLSIYLHVAELDNMIEMAEDGECEKSDAEKEKDGLENKLYQSNADPAYVDASHWFNNFHYLFLDQNLPSPIFEIPTPPPRG